MFAHLRFAEQRWRLGLVTVMRTISSTLGTMSEAETAIRRLHDLGIPSDRILLRNLSDAGAGDAGAGVFLSAKVTPEQASEATYILKGNAAQPPIERAEPVPPRPDPIPTARPDATRREPVSEKASWPPTGEPRPRVQRQAAPTPERPQTEERDISTLVSRQSPLRLLGLFLMLIIIGLALGYVIGLMA